MALVVWDSKYLTGNAEVDHQHQELFALINTLHDAIVAGKGRELLMPTLDKLAAYVIKHFRAEETLMQAQGYPGFAEHKAKHEDLARKTTETIDGYRNGKLLLTTTLSRFLGDWITTHVMGDDFAMVTWLKSRR
jgi:hemerythrin